MANIHVLAAVLLGLVCSISAMMIAGQQMSIDDAIIKAGSNGSMSKMFEIMQDEDTVMIELDMLYKMDTYNEMVKDMVPIGGEESSRKKRKAIRSTAYRWTNQRIPYEISYEFTANDRSIITAAINDYHRYTCLRFVPASSSDRNRVRFQNGGGCSSYVGMIGDTQTISLAPGCRYKGIIIHEMGHAVGFQHEQTRPDRDAYVYINSANIQSGVEYNFMKYTTSQVNNYGVPYDYTSVMHYSGTAFTKNGQPTIIARDSRYQNAMGNRDGFSFKDIQLANTLYSCASVQGCRAIECPEGFQGPDCECWCDSGDRLNPVKKCDGTGPSPASTTTPRPTQPITCEDKNQNCPHYVQVGYCTGQHENYMRENCAYSCNTCEAPTTVPPTMPPAGCRDENSYCSSWAGVGECSRNPSYMWTNCKKSCKACDGDGGESTCIDMNTNCPGWVAYCNHGSYRSYLADTCRKSCGYCSSRNEQSAVAPDAGNPSGSCSNNWSDRRCAKKAHTCGWNSLVSYNCKKSCSMC